MEMPLVETPLVETPLVETTREAQQRQLKVGDKQYGMLKLFIIMKQVTR